MSNGFGENWDYHDGSPRQIPLPLNIAGIMVHFSGENTILKAKANCFSQTT